MSSGTIICNLNGRLGNILFEIAYGYKLSQQYNLPLIIKSNIINNIENTINQINKIYHQPFEPAIINKKLPYQTINDSPDFTYRDNICNMNSNINLSGYFQSEKYFYDIRKQIPLLFYLEGDDLQLLNKVVSQHNIGANSVSIHIRRGDYQSFSLFSIIPMSYYKKCIDFFGRDKDYVIFSDDIDWCKKQELFNSLPSKVFMEGNQPHIDMFLMSKCGSNIITNSTFSWWGAYLNQNINKKVLAPNFWFNSADLSRYNSSDIIPLNPNWNMMPITDICFISAYFKLEQSKASHDIYIKRMKNTLNINHPFVIFLDKDDVETTNIIYQIRGHPYQYTKIIRTTLNDLKVSKYDWEAQYKLDNEKYQNPSLYKIWNNKADFVWQVAVENPFNSKYFFWIDIGYLRYVKNEDIYTNISLSKIPDNKLMLLELHDEHSNQSKHRTIAAGMFGGDFKAVSWFGNVYYNYLDKCISKGDFCGKEQNLMVDIVKENPNQIKLLKTEDDWYYMFWYLHSIHKHENVFLVIISLILFLFLAVIFTIWYMKDK